MATTKIKPAKRRKSTARWPLKPTEASDADNAALVLLLALCDSIWIPCRNWRSPGPSNRYVARREYRTRGVEFASAGGSDIERQSHHRMLARLREAGMVRLLARGGAMYPRARLTDSGEGVARRLCGLPPLRDCWITCRKVAELTKRPGSARLMSDVWLSEATLVGDATPQGQRGFVAAVVESLMLPALARGFGESNCDLEGSASYRLTRAGWRWIASDPPAAESDFAGDRAARRIYDDVLASELTRLDVATPARPREIGPVPLPVALEGVRLNGAG